MDHESEEFPSLIDANEGDRGKFSELSLTLLLKNKLILIFYTITLQSRFSAKLQIFNEQSQQHGMQNTSDYRKAPYLNRLLNEISRIYNWKLICKYIFERK